MRNLTQIAQQRGLQIGLAVALRQVKEVEEVAVFEYARGVLGQNSRSLMRVSSIRQDIVRSKAAFSESGEQARGVTPV
jgi:hypothetical protein